AVKAAPSGGQALRRLIGWYVSMSLFAAGMGAVAARAAPGVRRSTPRPAAPTPATQADGMVASITDQLWAETDGYWHKGRYEDDIALSYVVIQVRPRFLEPYETASWLIDSNGRHEEAEQ